MATSAMYREANDSQPSLRAPTLPPYSEYPSDIDQRDIDLAKLSRSSSSDSLAETAATAAPDEKAGAAAAGTTSVRGSDFRPTRQLQVQTSGKQWLSLPLAPRPDPIPVYGVVGDHQLDDRPVYLSMRPQRRSGSCALVGGDDPSETPLTTTEYRFGPGRPPRVRLGAADDDDEFEIEGVKTFSRAVAFRSARLGEFQWRYASRAERQPWAASSLLVLERMPPASSSAPSQEKQQQQQPIRVAQLLRNEQYRSPGSGASTAGNGGRLMLDLTLVDEKQRDLFERLAVTTALVMLKKEVDRRRMHQIMIMGGAAGGGP